MYNIRKSPHIEGFFFDKIFDIYYVYVIVFHLYTAGR